MGRALAMMPRGNRGEGAGLFEARPTEAILGEGGGRAIGRCGRIALFLPSQRLGGGAERVMLNLAQGLALRGVPVDIVHVNAAGPFFDQLPGEVRLISLNARHTRSSLPALLRYLRRVRPAVMVANLLSGSILALMAKKALFGRVPVVVRYSHTFSMRYAEAGRKGRICMQLAKRLWRSADALVAVSRGAAQDLERSVPGIASRLQTIANPVVWPDHLKRASEPVEHPWFGDRKAPVILSVGRLVPQKNHANLLRAFAELLKSRPAKLVILGEGPLRPRLQDLARRLGLVQAVDFPGFRSNPFPFMAKASAFVLSSDHEALPLALIEALACGTPVVSTDCPHGPREILEGGKWGRLVPARDERALAKAILDTLEHPIAAEALRARANFYSVQAGTDRYLSLFARLGCGAP